MVSLILVCILVWLIILIAPKYFIFEISKKGLMLYIINFLSI